MKMFEPRKTRQIDPWMDARSTRRADRAYVVMDERIRIECDPPAEKREPITEVKGAEACSRIAGGKFFCASYILKTEKATQKRMKSDGLVSLPSPNDHSIEAKFKV